MGKWSDPRVGRVGHIMPGRIYLLRRVISFEEGVPCGGRRMGRSKFAICELLIGSPRQELPLWPLLFWRITDHNLIFTVLQESSEVRGVVPGVHIDVNIDKGQCHTPEVNPNYQGLRHGIVRENVTISHSIGAECCHRLRADDYAWWWHSLWTLWGNCSCPVWFLTHRQPTPGDDEGSSAVLRSSAECRCSWTAQTCPPLLGARLQKYSSGQESGVWWRGSPQKRDSNVFAPFPKTPPLWRALQVGPGWNMGSYTGQSVVVCCGTDSDAVLVAPIVTNHV